MDPVEPVKVNLIDIGIVLNGGEIGPPGEGETAVVPEEVVHVSEAGEAI